MQALPLTDAIGLLVDHQTATSLKEGATQEASDAIAATSSGGNVPKKGRKFSSVLGTRRKATGPVVSSSSVFDCVVGTTHPHIMVSYSGLGRVSTAAAKAKDGDDRREVSKCS